MSKVLIKSVIGVVLLGVLGTFTFRIYQQRAILFKFYPWFISGKYISEGVNVEQMHQFTKIKDLNDSLPPLVKIFNASTFTGTSGLETADIEMCRSYYQKVLGHMPQLKEAHVFLGLCEYKAGNIPEAFHEYKQGLESDAGIFWSNYNLGALAMMNGNNEDAKALFLQVVKLSLADVLTNILASKLFQQYIQINNITPQKVWDGLNEVRVGAIQNLKFIEEYHTSTPSISTKHEMRLRIF